MPKSKKYTGVYRYQGKKGVTYGIDYIHPFTFERVRKIVKASTEAEAGAASRAVELYGLQQHWDIYFFPISTFHVFQPYLTGYQGEMVGWSMLPYEYARLWIDHDFKTSMGR